VVLGKDTKPLVVLHTREDLHRPHATHAGLYHFAMVFSSRGDLARTINRILKTTPHLFTGSADHLVSEAFYFNDPEGNGIELYFDRDRTEWQWENGQIKMATLYIDPIEYLERNIVLEEEGSELKMGHFHLKVGDIEAAKKFYIDILGFEKTAELPGALFVSVGGYHHHIGMNTWESRGAEKRNPSLGLHRIEFVFSEKGDVEELKKRLKENHIEFKEEQNTLLFHDSWKNEIVITII
jgi:catechol 2,3-dioxygenase